MTNTGDLAYKQKNGQINKLFCDVAQEWLHYIKSKRKYSTYVKYHESYQKYLSQLDAVPIRQLTTDIIIEELTYLNAQDSDILKSSTYAMLNRIIKFGNKKYNLEVPLFFWEGEISKKKSIDIFNHTEQAKLFRFLYSETDVPKSGILLCLSTGLRLGEICALKWSDIDLNTKVLHVTSTVQRISVDGQATKTILYESEPKSDCSVREIPLSDDMVSLLKAIPAGGKYILNSYKPMEPRTYQNKLKTYLQQAGVTKKNFHTLRHTFATNCIESGMDVKSLSEILGHADVQITLNRYVHPSIETKRNHINNLSSVYGQFRE